MIDESLKRKFKSSANSLMNKYDMFFTNQQYSSQHFQTENEYITIQKALATEIQIEENIMKEFLIKYLKLNFPNLKLVCYDSRPICLTDICHRIGGILIKGLNENENEINSIKESFKNDTDMTVLITRWESLDEETKTKLSEFCHL